MTSPTNSPRQYALYHFDDLCDYLRRCDLSYREKIWHAIENLTPGQRIVIADQVKNENLQPFVEAVCAYIWIYRSNEVVFSDDYTEVRKQ